MLKPVRSVAPTGSPITVAEAKTWLSVDHDDHDTLIQLLIDGAVDHCDGYEGEFGQAIMAQTWYQDFPCFLPEMRLPVRPVTAVTEIEYANADGLDVVIDNSNYYLFNDDFGPYVAPAPAYSWPSAYNRIDAVRITWTAGAANAAAVPARMKLALLYLVRHFYDHRDDEDGGKGTLPETFKALEWPIRRMVV